MRKIISSLTLLAMLVTFTGCGFGGAGSMTIHAKMADAAGLFVGNDVGILGVPVGKVTSIEPAGDGVEVTMEIDGDRNVPADAGAVVVARSVATDRYVELTPVYHSGPRMQDGAHIDMAHTKTPVDFDNVLSAINTLATNLAGHGDSAQAVEKVIESGSKTLAGKGGMINTTITSLASAVNAVSNQRGNITGTLQSLDTLTAVLAQNQATVRAFIDQITRAAALLAGERKNFQLAMTSFSQAVRLVAQFSKDNKAQITRSLNQTTAIMKTLMAKRGDIRELLRKMPLALQNVRNAAAGGKLTVKADFIGILTNLNSLLSTVCGATVGNLPVAGQTVCGALSTLDLSALSNVLGSLNLGGLAP